MPGALSTPCSTDVPAGVAHRRIAALVLVLVLAGTVHAYEDLVGWLGADSVFEYTFLFCLAFLTGTYLLSPDLDVSGSDPARSWGIVQTIWRPYASVFKHRGVSHVPVLGTLTRLLYLAALAYVCGSVLYSLMDRAWPISVDDLRTLAGPRAVCLFAGLVVSDLAHLAADRFFSR